MLPQYSMPLYRPPSEADSLLIQVTLGCPHNRCTFCPMYKGVSFRTRPLDTILEEIDGAAESLGDQVKTVFLPDGNTICLKTEKLLPILERLRLRFPDLERITCYGSARYVLKKSLDELKRLKAAGLTRIHMGIESGDASMLEELQKGATPEEMVQAGCRAREAGMEVSEYILVGVAGPERSEAHARASADLINRIQPAFLRLRTYVPVPGTPLGEAWQEGRFTLLAPKQCLQEIKTLVTCLEGPVRLVSDHISNYANINGLIPQDKAVMLEMIDRCLALDDEAFRHDLMGWQL